eukprot:2852364-Alexandrium_andersonii.AAC.1
MSASLVGLGDVYKRQLRARLRGQQHRSQGAGPQTAEGSDPPPPPAPKPCLLYTSDAADDM